MPRATQAKLPATLPTPAEARSALRLCRQERAEKSKALEGLKLRLEQAKAREKSCAAEIERHEALLLDADEGSPEDLAESAEHVAAIREHEKAEKAREAIEEGMPFAKSELKETETRLRGARADVRAIADGRRRA